MPEQAFSENCNAPLQMQCCMGVMQVKASIAVGESQNRHSKHTYAQALALRSFGRRLDQIPSHSSSLFSLL